MKKILIVIMTLFSIAAQAGGELVNKSTGEIIELMCNDANCTEFQFVITAGQAKQVVKKVTPQMISKRLASLIDHTDYFPITDALTSSDDGPFMYSFPLLWPVIAILTAADLVYSAGAFAGVGIPTKAKIAKIKKDVKRMYQSEGEFRIADKRFNRVKEFIMSL